MLAGVPVDRRDLAGVPMLVIGGGLDRTVSLEDTERLAEWLGADLRAVRRPLALRPGRSARTSYQQVADAIRAFLETNRS